MNKIIIQKNNYKIIIQKTLKTNKPTKHDQLLNPYYCFYRQKPSGT